MAVSVAQALMEAGLDVQLVLRKGKFSELELPVLYEPSMQGFHPLHGMLWALKSLKENECALIAPCDMPYLRTEGIQALLTAGAPAVAFDGERVHPLLALVPSSWTERVEEVLQRGGAALEVFEHAPRVLIPAGQLVNVNRPEDIFLSS